MIMRKYTVLICVAASLALLLVATSLYPGGHISDKSSPGFDWTRNFFSNLFRPTALNGAENTGRVWALLGMAFHSVGFGVFFLHTSRKLSSAHAAGVVKTIGLVNILCTFLIATPLHDLMALLSISLFLAALFYLTVLAFQARARLLRWVCALCMLTFYAFLLLYGLGLLVPTAIMQKVAFLGSMALVLGIEYFTGPEHFAPARRAERVTPGADLPRAA